MQKTKQFFILHLILFQLYMFTSDNMLPDDILSDAKKLWNIDEYPTLQEIIGKRKDIKDTWKLGLKNFPAYLVHGGAKTLGISKEAINDIKNKLKPIIQWNTFLNLIKKATELLREQINLDNYPDYSDYNKQVNAYTKALKIDTTDILHKTGDLHGSWHDIVNFIQQPLNDNKESFGFTKDFTLKEQFSNHHFLFLGDLTDSGARSIETLTFVLALFLKNPNNIHIIRGNHEDILMNNAYGFLHEIVMQFNFSFRCDLKNNLIEMCDDQGNNILILLKNFYDLLPVGLWLVRSQKNKHEKYNVDLCVHGGFEPKDKGIGSWLNNFASSEKKYDNRLVCGNYDSLLNLGYTGADFCTNSKVKIAKGTRSGGLTYQITQFLFEKWKEKEFKNTNIEFQKIYRAHQHALAIIDCMPYFYLNKGICMLWPNKDIITLCVMPSDGGFGIPFEEENNDNILDQHPGVIFPTVVTNIYQNNQEIIKFTALPNNKTPEDIFNKHKKIMQEYQDILSIQKTQTLKKIFVYTDALELRSWLTTNANLYDGDERISEHTTLATIIYPVQNNINIEYNALNNNVIENQIIIEKNNSF